MNMAPFKAFLASGSFVLAACTVMPMTGYAMQETQASVPAAKSASVNSKTAPGDQVEQRLIAEERLSWELAIKKEGAPYKALHSPVFFTVSDNGETDRGRSEASALDASVHFSRWDLSEFRVHFLAKSTAMVTYHVKAAGLDRGKAFQLDSYASSLWTMENGEWRNAFYQSTPAATK
jgi:hypothetical protein